MTNPRSIDAIDVAERFANGKATEKELKAAMGDPWIAARNVAMESAMNRMVTATWNASLTEVPTIIGTEERDAEMDKQKTKLIEMIKEEI